MTEVIKSFTGKYWFLSNYYTELGLWIYGYPTMEHYFQAMKTTDIAKRKAFKDPYMPPGFAKTAGRLLDLRDDWEDIKVDAMLAGLRKKFSSGSLLATKLLATGDAQLIEGNHWHDNFWGDCICGRLQCQGATNKLGFLLMQVRSELQ